MTRAEFIQLVHYKGTGKPVAPASGTKKYNQIVLAGQYFTASWLSEPGTDWASLFDFRNSGTITATDTFPLDSSIKKVSQQEGDLIRILHTDGNESEYDLVPIDRLRENRNNYTVAVNGTNLMFSKAFTADDPQFGGTIIVPSYTTTTFPDADDGEIAIDDPFWLVAICAGEFVRNDITRKAEYPNLLGEAANLMQKMKENNGTRVDELYRPNFFVPSGEIWSE